MHKQAIFALAHPVFDPERQIVSRHFWQLDSKWFPQK